MYRRFILRRNRHSRIFAEKQHTRVAPPYSLLFLILQQLIGAAIHVGNLPGIGIGIQQSRHFLQAVPTTIRLHTEAIPRQQCVVGEIRLGNILILSTEWLFEPPCRFIPIHSFADAFFESILRSKTEIALRLAHIALPIALTHDFKLVAIERARLQPQLAYPFGNYRHGIYYP